MLSNKQLNAIAEMTKPQLELALYACDVPPLSYYVTTIEIMDKLLSYGYSGRELDGAMIHGCRSDKLGDLKFGPHREYLHRRIDENGKTAGYRKTGSKVMDYCSALRLQLILKVEERNVTIAALKSAFEN